MKFFKPTQLTIAVFFGTLFIQIIGLFFTVVSNILAYPFMIGYTIFLWIGGPLFQILQNETIAAWGALAIYLILLYVFASFVAWVFQIRSKNVWYIVTGVFLLGVLTYGGTYLYEHRYDKSYTLLPVDQSCAFPFYIEVFDPIQPDETPLLPKELVMNSDNEYQKLLSLRQTWRKCIQNPLPTVDFSQATVLGRYAIGSCASYGFSRRYERDDNNKTATYTVASKDQMISCSGPGKHSMNLIQVDKIPSDYKIIFPTEKYSGGIIESHEIDCVSQEVRDLMIQSGATNPLSVCQ